MPRYGTMPEWHKQKIAAAVSKASKGIQRIVKPQIRTAPTEKPNFRDLVLAAGWYEGEGTVRTDKGRIQVGIAQSDEWMPNRLKALFGGSIYILPPGYMKQHFTKEYNIKEMRRWQLTGVRARGFLMTIYPFCSPRRQTQIKTALDSWRQTNYKVAA
jgi:hypothetical protein